ncbi:hypothetical protein P3L10_020974 [Capsicum annuum]
MYKHPSTPSSGQTLLNFQTKESPGEYWKFEQEVVTRALVEMIIIDELPFSFVENKGFKKFMSKVQPLFQITSRRTIARDCYDVYGKLRLSLKRSFREMQSRICLTTDTWTSVQRINYMYLTAHFIDRDWVFHKRILNFCPITSHQGNHLVECISNCFLDWNVDNVFSVTVDNASSNNITVSALSKKLDMWGTNIMDGKHLYVRCIAHILNLIMQDGLNEIGPSIKQVRQMVKYVRSSPAITKNFKKYCEMQKIKYSKMLSVDVPTRWNSTYLMLEVAEKFEKAFERFDLYEDSFNSYLFTNIGEDGTVAGSIQSDDWVNIRNVIKFLQRFYELTLKVLSSCFALEELLGKAKGKKASDEVESYLRDFFAFYERKYSKGSKNNSSSLGYTLSDSSRSDSSNSGHPQSLKTNTLRNKLHMKKKSKECGSIGGTKSELDKYLGEDQEPMLEPRFESESEDFDILNW